MCTCPLVRCKRLRETVSLDRKFVSLVSPLSTVDRRLLTCLQYLPLRCFLRKRLDIILNGFVCRQSRHAAKGESVTKFLDAQADLRYIRWTERHVQVQSLDWYGGAVHQNVPGTFR